MVKSLYSGVSGLKTHQQRMDVIGNNIANVNTTGYKTNVVTFADVYYQTKRTPSGATSTLGGVNPRQVGYGVKMNTTTPNMSQSGFTYSDSIYDMALDGEGFFQLMDGAGNKLYTRAGVFNIDEEGYLVNSNGYHVLGISGDTDGQPAGSEIIRITLPETQANASSATKMINGTNVTLSVSAPSDITDMSVTFQHSEYPYATYANGILNIFFNTEAQYGSAADFQAAIKTAIDAGGITLPDDVELNFDFETVPVNADAEIASNRIESWQSTTNVASGEVYAEYTYTDPVDGTTSTKSAQIGFKGANEDLNGAKITLTYGSPESVKYTPASGSTPASWAISVTKDSTATSITKLINEAIENDPSIPKLTITSFVLPSDETNRKAALTALGSSSSAVVDMKCGLSDVGLEISATEAGAFANDYKITFAYSASYGKTKAVWDEDNLTITICNDTTLADIQEAVRTAANGNSKKDLKIVSFTGLSDMNPAQRKEMFSANPSLSLGGGKDSFFTEVAKSLSNFNLTDGRTGSAQSYKDLENVTIQTDGTIIGIHSVFGYMTLGRVDIAT
ncbi:MAG: flagellar hook-basal body complex protein, partial [Oscillospiraceae bacterium]